LSQVAHPQRAEVRHGRPLILTDELCSVVVIIATTGSIMADGKLKAQDDNDNAVVDDGFWDVALIHNQEAQLEIFDDEHIDHQNGGKFTLYHLPNTSITLKLAQLPQEDGVWSPVGSDAWYSSALLTSLILREVTSHESSTSTSNKTDGMFPQTHDKAVPLRILELGSGAKALPGFAAAAALSLFSSRFPSWTVTLTDNHKDILHQLEANVAANQVRIISSEKSNIQRINVEYLDWGTTDESTEDPNKASTLDADVVIGSELAYSEETATALAKILSALLHRNPHAAIWIVQVTDRHGWEDIVIPSLQSKPNVKIEYIPLTWDIHNTAGGLIQMGGVLDRFAFVVVKISKVSN
jgi:hypothetical protein